MMRSLLARLRRHFGEAPDRTTRRELLKKALAASAGLLLGAALPGCGKSRPKVAVRVAVVGGGFAGLACAHELQEAGYTVELFEASQRLGGRVSTVRDLAGGKVVEGGGEFIGTNHPTWLAYAKHFHLELADLPEHADEDTAYILDGKRLKEKDARRLHKEMDEGADLLIEDAEDVDADEPWRSPDAAALDKRSLGDVLAEMKIGELGKRGLAAEFTANMGVQPARMSYLGVLSVLKAHGLEKYWTETESFRCKGGNEQLTAKLTKKIGKERLHEGTPITAIRVHDNGASVRSADDKWHDFDDVVLAVPPSTWSKIGIEPALPDELTVQMGTTVKYLAAVKGRWWQRAKLTPEGLCESGLGLTWEATDTQKGTGEAVLASSAGGSAADLRRRLADEERRAAYAKDFEVLLPGFGGQFLRDRFFDWPGEPWTLGGWSCPAPGQLTVYGPILKRGLGRLHFAGEHACFGFTGFMEGALRSGAAVARRLAVRDGVIKE
jgi:monoamine oxidase